MKDRRNKRKYDEIKQIKDKSRSISKGTDDFKATLDEKFLEIEKIKEHT